MKTEIVMNRREAIKKTALLMGAAVSSSAILGVLNGCTPKPGIDWIPTFFTEDQAILITQVAEIIIPKTETPGATDVGVPGFIEQIIKETYTKEKSDLFLQGLGEFDLTANERMGKSFIQLDPEDQQSFTIEIHNAAIAEKADQRPFILVMKELTMLGFFISEVGATQVLQYKEVPGEYKGCISLEEAGGRQWA
ncbi:MAG: gluconate 2-dehydrogenase subunit 3 family protein [Flammeovirgaceae bacterium]|nr:gluconate 2-dehydrogenase subunit 3 family protein [Flammeovirgaceae bacterium]